MPFFDVRTYTPDTFGILRADIREDFAFRPRSSPAAREKAKSAKNTEKAEKAETAART
ncbi:hypothetical protein [Streptomyces cyaneofuscatus]|uniref:hypothetical protein n=1 Tax=Streptomyces cyaneofuscatus TaxID=66883 RepID=UPI003F54135F